jgi:hypothetical protein
MDLINYSYFIVVDVVERSRRIRVVNYYDNILGPRYIYIRSSWHI